MHRNIDAAVEERILDFLGEECFPFQLVQRAVHFRIAPRLENHDVGAHAAVGETGLDPFGLPPRQTAPPGAELHAKRRVSASTRPGTVCGSASMTLRKPSSRAVAAVIWPIVAAPNRPAGPAPRPPRRPQSPP